MKRISEIIKELNIPDDYVDEYGKYKGKISNEYYDKIKDKKNAKLILVTSVNPTPMGEGKTTQSIGIAMAMKKIGKKAIAVLREPSLGPVFGIKGGAIGGGKSVLEPAQDIDLHFNGDFHAITSANNLLVAVLENHIFQGNELNIDINQICIKRAIDMNDRGLRKITVGEGGKQNDVEYQTGFEITAACELMAICCLCEDENDLKNRLNNILVAYNCNNEPVYAKELSCTNAMLALLKNAIKPNIVQTQEETPCIVHLGPFANIAHGCNSVIATKLGLKLADYCITEAGFGADLGAEKFFDIKCRKANIKPDIAVLVVTIKALKYNGGVKIQEIEKENIDALKDGICNLKRHIENIQKYGVPLVICINKFSTDTQNEIEYIKDYCKSVNVQCEISTAFENGSDGAIDIANLIVEKLETQKTDFKYIYNDEDSISEKIEKVCKKIYGASEIIYLEEAKKKLEYIEKLGYTKLPVCIAKTPMSFTDDDKILGAPSDFRITIRDMKISSGAGFIVVYAGNIVTMPGLGRNSKYLNF